jgi:diguanylate cyclase
MGYVIGAAVVIGLIVVVAYIFIFAHRTPEKEASPATRAPENAEARESRIDQSVRTIRDVLLRLAGSIQKVDAAADNSSLALAAARQQINALELNAELGDAQGLLVKEIDRVITSNSALRQELEAAQSNLARQREEIESLQTAVRTDTLTRLGNRAYFNERLQEAIERFGRYQETFSLLLLDIDHFKKINDTHGHVVGDDVLQKLGAMLKGALRSSDHVARYGGEEFAMILMKNDEVTARSKATEILRAVAGHKFGSVNSVTFSAGVAQIQPGDNAKTLVERADKALYLAKETGRNRVCSTRDLA